MPSSQGDTSANARELSVRRESESMHSVNFQPPTPILCA